MENGSVEQPNAVREGLVQVSGERNFCYRFCFSSEETARQFVIDFWHGVDTAQNYPENMLTAKRFDSGQWKPEQQLTRGCRTMWGIPTQAEQEKGVLQVVIQVSGNGVPLQQYGVTALESLVNLPE